MRPRHAPLLPLAQAVTAALVLSAAAASAQAPAERGPVVVHLADGTSLPLLSWSLSYEVASWRQGTSPAFASFNRAVSSDIWLGKKAYPTAGATLEIGYDEVERERELEGEVRKVRVAVARTLTLAGADGKKSMLKLEPPVRDLVMPGADKNLLVQPRSLDLMGQTLTGTKRELCLVSFSTLVECSATAGEQVVKIEFPK